MVMDLRCKLQKAEIWSHRGYVTQLEQTRTITLTIHEGVFLSLKYLERIPKVVSKCMGIYIDK